MRYYVFIMLALFCTSAYAHEMTPAYPELKHSYQKGVLQTEVQIFNRRDDVEYYELGVFDDNWNQVAFATQDKITRIKYLEKKTITIYVREKDQKKARYICSLSKIKKENLTATSISSRICSKFK